MCLDPRGPPLQPPGFSIDPVEPVVVTDPESSIMIGIDRIHPIESKIVGARPAAKCFEGSGVYIEVIRPVSFKAYPDVSLPIVSQRNDMVLGDTVRIGGIMSIADKVTPLWVQAQKAQRLRANP